MGDSVAVGRGVSKIGVGVSEGTGVALGISGGGTVGVEVGVWVGSTSSAPLAYAAVGLTAKKINIKLSKTEKTVFLKFDMQFIALSLQMTP
jgi:hypothetical protein